MLTWGQFVALVGAAAWLPPIIGLFRRARVTLVPGGQIEIGFNELGPLFNPKLAFRAERRDALITGIEYRVTHERGQQTLFRCVQLVEYGVQSESTSGERSIHHRAQDIVAIVVTPRAIAERKTNSREVGCLEHVENLSIALGRATERMRRDGVDWIDDVIRSPEYAALRRFLHEARTWQVGEYRVECMAHVAGRRNAATCRFRFVLGDGAVALLNTNLSILERNFRQSYMPAAPGQENRKPEPVKWVYPNALAWNTRRDEVTAP